MEEMVNQTMPVIVRDSVHGDVVAVLYAREEGSAFEVYMCGSELEADMLMKEYERSGLFTRLIPWTDGRVEVLEPVYMVKMQGVAGLRKEFRVITLPKSKVVNAIENSLSESPK